MFTEPRFLKKRKSQQAYYQGPLGEKVLNLVTPLLKKRGFVEGKLLRDWTQIVGPQWSAFSCPEKIFFPAQKREEGTLFIRVWGGAAVEIQHQMLSILDRINGYFGYKAVAYLSLKQGPPPLTTSLSSFPSVSKGICTSAQKEVVSRLVQPIPQGDLKAALGRLGEALFIEENKLK